MYAGAYSTQDWKHKNIGVSLSTTYAATSPRFYKEWYSWQHTKMAHTIAQQQQQHALVASHIHAMPCKTRRHASRRSGLFTSILLHSPPAPVPDAHKKQTPYSIYLRLLRFPGSAAGPQVRSLQSPGRSPIHHCRKRRNHIHQSWSPPAPCNSLDPLNPTLTVPSLPSWQYRSIERNCPRTTLLKGT